jgi:hypothetical protein
MERMAIKIDHPQTMEYLVAIAGAAMYRVKLSKEGLNAPKVFYNNGVPGIDLNLYLGRLVHSTNVKYKEEKHRGGYPNDYFDSIGIRSLTLASVYVERLCSRSLIKLDAFNVHKLFAAAFVIALKYIEDEQPKPNILAEICGLDCKTLCAIILKFCDLSDFRFGVSSEEFDKVLHLFQKPSHSAHNSLSIESSSLIQ